MFKTATAPNAGGNAVFDDIAEFPRSRNDNILKVRSVPAVLTEVEFQIALWSLIASPA